MMNRTLVPGLAVAFAAAACGHGEVIERRGPTPAEAAPLAVRGQAILADDAASVNVERVPTPIVVRGLYVNRWAALGRRIYQLIELAKTTEINTLVIDVKDDRGLVLYRSRVALARQAGADTDSPMSLNRLRALLDTMRVYGIYPVARIVVAKDPLLARSKLDWAIKRKADSLPWLDRTGIPWLDPHRREIWKYAADLAEEAYDLGFSEIQFDYVRFPDERRLIREAAFPLARGRFRAQVIRDQLEYVRELLSKKMIRMTIDVFGLTATDSTDMGIGQRWEMFIDQADVILPMTYPSHFGPGTYGLSHPNARPYETIDNAMKDVTRRTTGVKNAGKIIPWYQDFTLGRPRYGVEQIRAQIQAGYDNGYYDWILWNARSRYTVAALRPKSALFEDIQVVIADSLRRARGDTVRTARSDTDTSGSDTAFVPPDPGPREK
jgi:hypothetical protein